MLLNILCENVQKKFGLNFFSFNKNFILLQYVFFVYKKYRLYLILNLFNDVVIVCLKIILIEDINI